MHEKNRRMGKHVTLSLLGMIAAGAGQAQAAGNDTPASAPGTHAAVVDFRNCAKPRYPRAELEAGHEGTVSLRFQVKTDGTVGDTRLLASSGFPVLDDATAKALSTCKFEPATREGQPVETWTSIQYVWSRK